MAEDMALKAVSVMVLYLLATCAAKQNCSEIQCKLLPVDEYVASEFQAIKNSKNGVRMIYLNLLIGNDSYHPLELQDEFLPNRWVWAATIGELMLSLSYDYDSLSWGLLKRQVRRIDVQLKEEPSGCLAGLNSSCQNIVVAKALFDNVTTKYGSHIRENVVCVAEIDQRINSYEKFFEGDVQYRCCKVVKHIDRLNSSIRCEFNVQKSNWFKAFYTVLNALTVVVAFYSPALLVLLPDFILNVRKEDESEQQEEEEEERQRQLQQNGYESIPSSEEQETVLAENINEDNSEWVMLKLRQPAALPEALNRNENEANVNESNSREPNENGPNELDNNEPNDPHENEPNNASEPSPGTTKDDHEENREAEEIPLDDGSPFSISTLLSKCKSAGIFQQLCCSTKLSFNMKLLILWYFVTPIFFYIKFALDLTMKDEYLDEIVRKDVALLDGGLFFVFRFSEQGNLVQLIVSWLVIPFLVIAILRPRHLKSCESSDYIGEGVIPHLKNGQEEVASFYITVLKKMIIVYTKFQNICNWFRIKPRPGVCWKRFLCVIAELLLLILSVVATVIGIISAAFCLAMLFVCTTFALLLYYSPYGRLGLFCFQKLWSQPWFVPLLLIVYLIGLLVVSQFVSPLYNPFIYVFFSFTYPFFLAWFSCRFLVKMFGYTIIGLILNGEITAPIATFAATTTAYLFGCYLNSQTKYKELKEIIFEEWKGSKEIIKKIDEEKVLRVTNDTVPTELFWFVCDESKVLPFADEIRLMLRNMTIIFLFAFFALSAVFFGTSSYKISPVASTIAVFISGKIPMLLLTGSDNCKGWEKIERNRKIKEAVNKFIIIKIVEQKFNTDPDLRNVNKSIIRKTILEMINADQRSQP